MGMYGGGDDVPPNRGQKNPPVVGVETVKTLIDTPGKRWLPGEKIDQTGDTAAGPELHYERGHAPEGEADDEPMLGEVRVAGGRQQVGVHHR